MRNEEVIALAPYVNAVGSSLMLASFYTSGRTSLALCYASLAVLFACLGALLTHYPSAPARSSDEPSPAGHM